MTNNLNEMVAVAAGTNQQVRNWARQLRSVGVRYYMAESVAGDRAELWVDRDEADRARSAVLCNAIPDASLIW